MRSSDWSSDVCSSDLLVGIRPDGPWPVLAQDAAEQEVVEDEETTALRDRLAASSLTPERQELLFNLGLFHKREAKPAQWTVFDSAARDEEELVDDLDALAGLEAIRSEEHTSELQSLMRISYAGFCLKKKRKKTHNTSKAETTYETQT